MKLFHSLSSTWRRLSFQWRKGNRWLRIQRCMWKNSCPCNLPHLSLMLCLTSPNRLEISKRARITLHPFLKLWRDRLRRLRILAHHLSVMTSTLRSSNTKYLHHSTNQFWVIDQLGRVIEIRDPKMGKILKARTVVALSPQDHQKVQSVPKSLITKLSVIGKIVSSIRKIQCSLNLTLPSELRLMMLMIVQKHQGHQKRIMIAMLWRKISSVSIKGNSRYRTTRASKRQHQEFRVVKTF